MELGLALDRLDMGKGDPCHQTRLKGSWEKYLLVEGKRRQEGTGAGTGKGKSWSRCRSNRLAAHRQGRRGGPERKQTCKGGQPREGSLPKAMIALNRCKIGACTVSQFASCSIQAACTVSYWTVKRIKTDGVPHGAGAAFATMCLAVYLIATGTAACLVAISFAECFCQADWNTEVGYHALIAALTAALMLAAASCGNVKMPHLC